jgi:hypothetical protein
LTVAITNAYVGTAQITNISTTGAGSRTFRNDSGASRKIGQQITTVGAFTLGAVALSIKKVEAADGNLAGTLTLYVADGSVVGEGANQVAFVINALEVPKTTAVYLHFGGAAKALAAATAYNFWLEYSGTTDANNYFTVDYNTQYAGGNEYDYDGAAWNAQTGKDLKMYLCDTADGGKYVIRTDKASSVEFAAGGCKGAAIATTDTYTITMGATLTRDSNFTCLQSRVGDTVTGVQAYAVQNAVGPSSARYRYGVETVNAGVTVSWTGNANYTFSGWIMNPNTADASSKSVRLNLNGTSGSHITVTNTGNAYAAAQSWSINHGYGSVLGAYVDFLYSGAGTTFAAISPSSARTNHTTHGINLPRCSIGGLTTGYGIFTGWVASPDLAINIENWTFSAGYNGGTLSWSLFYGSIPLTAQSTFSMRFSGAKFNQMAGATGGVVSFGTIFLAGSVIYVYSDCIYITDTRFSETTPTTFALADKGTGPELTATIDNIGSFNAADQLVFYNNAGVELDSCSVAAYIAALYNKPANCWIIGGLVAGTAYTGIYCKATRDRILFSAASNTANGIPFGTAPTCSFTGNLRKAT